MTNNRLNVHFIGAKTEVYDRFFTRRLRVLIVSSALRFRARVRTLRDKQCFHFYTSSHSIQVWAVTFSFVAASAALAAGRSVGSRSLAGNLDLRRRWVGRASTRAPRSLRLPQPMYVTYAERWTLNAPDGNIINVPILPSVWFFMHSPRSSFAAPRTGRRDAIGK